MKDWQRFVVSHGWRAFGYELAHAIGRSVEEVERVRRTNACSRLKEGKRFAELFALWHGRPPRDDEWPAPHIAGAKGGGYIWQPPELALLASLVGRLSPKQIARVLTKRLRARTGDRRATRTRNAVMVGMQRLGLQTGDVVGGITAKAAAKEINSYAIVHQALNDGQLRARRVGRLWVISREAWEDFKAKRVLPPKGYVQLSSIRQALGMLSDAKLPEFAKNGYVPTAIRATPFGSHGATTRGTWFIDPKVAAKLVADRRAGRPMPWHGKPLADNLKATFKLWRSRQHPAECEACAKIWGKAGAPRTFEDYAARYPPLIFGAKRHLTKPWTPGLTVAEVARHVGRTRRHVLTAIDRGVLEATRRGSRWYVSRTEATLWKERKCTLGGDYRSWLSLASAEKQYLFKRGELQALIASGKLKSKVGTNGPMRGVTYVSKHACAMLRHRTGFSEAEAARRVGVSLARLRLLLKDAHWRGAAGIPLDTVRALQRRLKSQDGGYTIEEAAARLRTTAEWIHQRIDDGTIRIMRAKWDRRRLYVTQPMFQRLVREKKSPSAREHFDADWLLLTAAAAEAGVCGTTLLRWVDEGDLERRPSLAGWRYHRAAVRARARRYWKNVRLVRAVPPAWLQQERSAPHEDRHREHEPHRRRGSAGHHDTRARMAGDHRIGDPDRLPHGPHRGTDRQGPAAIPA